MKGQERRLIVILIFNLIFIILLIYNLILLMTFFFNLKARSVKKFSNFNFDAKLRYALVAFFCLNKEDN